MAAVHEHGEIDVVNALGRVAVASWSAVGGELRIVLATARSFGIAPADARRLLVDLAAVARTTAAARVSLCTDDPVVRSHARSEGFTGGLRADLECRAERWAPEAEPTPEVRVVASSSTRDATAAELGRLLPGAAVTIESGGPLARLAWRSETGMAGCGRVVAARRGQRIQVVVPLGPALMVESLAAALDTLLGLYERFAAVARSVPPVVFGMAAMDMIDGHISGQAAGGRITVNPAHVRADAVETLIGRYADAEERHAPRDRTLVPPAGRTLAVDEVVAHEVGHCVDGLAGNARISDTTAFRVGIGAALGVASVELALRGRDGDAQPEWQRAHARLVAEISDYAATSAVELFAEIFERWWCAADGPVVEAFAQMMNERFPIPH